MLRKKTSKKTFPIEKQGQLLREFYTSLHRIRNDARYSKQSVQYGRFEPSNMHVFDEIPMPFTNEKETTHDLEGTDGAYIKRLEKRQFTVGLTLSAEGEQHTDPVIIFRGKGDKKRLRP